MHSVLTLKIIYYVHTFKLAESVNSSLYLE